MKDKVEFALIFQKSQLKRVEEQLTIGENLTKSQELALKMEKLSIEYAIETLQTLLID